MIQVRIKADMHKGAPALHRGVRLQAGQLFAIEGCIDRPGDVRGIWTVKEWAFWQNFDVDCSLIFKLHEISEIVVTEGDPRRDVIGAVPLPVTVVPARVG